MNYNMDDLLKESLKPMLLPQEDLNRKILEGAGKVIPMKKRRAVSGLLKAAIIIICISCISVPTASAALDFIKGVYFKNNSVSTGNPAYVVEDNGSEKPEDIYREDLGRVEGGPNDKWVYKETNIVNSYTNTYYYYEDVADAFADAEMDGWLTEPVEWETYPVYIHSDGGDVLGKNIQVNILYGDGTVHFTQDRMTGNVAEDMAYVVPLDEASNRRTYKDFVLVDNRRMYGGEYITETIVMLRDEEYQGYLRFNGVSEEDMYQFLDSLRIGGSVTESGVTDIGAAETEEAEAGASEDEEAGTGLTEDGTTEAVGTEPLE